MTKKIIFALIIILVLAAGTAIFVFQPFGQKEKITVEKEKKFLSYERSIFDDETIPLDGAHEFWLKGDNVYVTSIKDHGLLVFNISDPANPKLISSFFDNEKTSMKRGHSIMFHANHAFINATGDNAIQVFDISDQAKTSPVAVIKEKEGAKSCLKGTHGMGIKGDYIYAAGTGDNALCFWNVADLKNVENSFGAIYDNDELALGGPHSVHFIENYMYILGDEGLQVFDISEPNNPKPVFMTTESVKGGHDIEQKGNYLYFANYKDGVSIFDASNPKEPKLAGRIAPTEENGLSLAADGDIIGNYWFVVSEKSNNLIMINISDPANPTIKETLRFDEEKTPFLYNGHFIRAIGNYLYISGLQNGFGIIKFTEPK
jgi:hypothetical protein